MNPQSLVKVTFLPIIFAAYPAPKLHTRLHCIEVTFRHHGGSAQLINLDKQMEINIFKVSIDTWEWLSQEQTILQR
jgi:hypothetical protein